LIRDLSAKKWTDQYDDEDDLIGVISECCKCSASLAVSDPELNLDQLL